jgi:uracil permease
MFGNKQSAAEALNPHPNGMLLEVDEAPKKPGKWIILAIQHVLAMFVACITVPMLVFAKYQVEIAGEMVSLASIMIAPTLFSAGIGTLFYLFATKFKSPMFLASSFAYMSAMSAAIGIDYEATGLVNLWVLPIGMTMVGLVYCLVALFIKLFGVKWLNKLLPTIVVGPVIIVIGLGLASSAISNLTTGAAAGGYNWCAILSGLVAMVVTAICAHYGKGTLSLVPFVIGMASGYVFAMIITLVGYYACGNSYCHVIDFSSIVNLFAKQNADGGWVANVRFQSFLDYPKFLFIVGQSSSVAPLSGSAVGQAALIFIPVSLVTICEHIGDHKNMSGLLQRDLLEDPGLTRTLVGDGVATAISGIFCGAANTTYGENVAVVGVTKIASTKVIALACVFSILLGFLAPVMAVVQTIPSCVTGGVSLILYGFIASSGVKMLINEKIDMGKTKNIFVASVILVAGIGGLAFKFAFPDAKLEITSVSVAMILGILMNVLLREKKDSDDSVKE